MYDYLGFIPTVVGDFEIDKKLLLAIFRIKSPSKATEPMAIFIKEFLTHYGINYNVDDIGNIYRIDNKDLPLLSAHMDTVQQESDLLLIEEVNIEEMNIKFKKDGVIEEESILKEIMINTSEPGGVIGADDKNGIYLILETLRNNLDKKFNFIFSVDEEIGCIGAAHFQKNNKIDHIPYGLVLDRRNSGDIICFNNSYGTKEFQDALALTGKNFGYSPTTGLSSDANHWSNQISCCNLSVGYYNPHQKDEFTILTEIENTYRYIHSLFDDLAGKVFLKPIKYMNNYGAGSYRGGSYYNDYGYDEEYWSRGSAYNKKNKPKTVPKQEAVSFFQDLDDKIYIKSLGVYVDYEKFEEIRDELDATFKKQFIGI